LDYPSLPVISAYQHDCLTLLACVFIGSERSLCSETYGELPEALAIRELTMAVLPSMLFVTSASAGALPLLLVCCLLCTCARLPDAVPTAMLLLEACE